MQRFRNLALGLLMVLTAPVAHASVGSRGTWDPAPAATASEIERGLSRYLGQDEFISGALSMSGRSFFFGGSGLEGTPVPAAARAADGAAREVVDGDIYALGPEGTKNLLLLNHYRGLTVLNFDRGANHPVLLGRVPSTGNYPRMMYANWTAKRAIVIEDWTRSTSGARILSYDLKDLSQPRVDMSLNVEGYVTDSRMVGDVLYIVGEESSQDRWSGHDESRSFVKSYRIQADGIKEVATVKLQNTVDFRENMGIQEARTGDGRYKYYVTAITRNRQSGWWWNAQSLIEVLDISSPDGQIAPVMVVQARGQVGKRSWVNIHSDTLVVTTNYRANENDNNVPMRVAVETYQFPKQGSEIISNEEYQFRKISLERQARLNSWTAGSEAYEDKVASGDLRLRQVFVRQGDHLVKPVSDFKVVDFGDSTGLSAAIQDVRYVRDSQGRIRLHVFWVPANMIDPLDIIDVTNTDARPVYQKRLLFDGWITRSFNVEHGGRHFIVALGYVIPANDNPDNRREAMAKIIEVIERRGQWEARDLDQITLPNVTWNSYDGHDKMTSFQFNPTTGRGSMLFQGSGVTGNRYITGGQVVEFDLSGSNPSLNRGAFIQGEEGWLRRVFYVPALQAMMTFSNQELGVFSAEQSESDKVLSAITRMELSRNVLAYLDLSEQLGRGLQVVRKGNYESPRTEVRLVPGASPDGERPVVAAFHEIPGEMVDFHYNNANQELMVLTRKQTSSYGNEEYRTTEQFTLQRLKVARDGFSAAAPPAEFENTRVYNHGRRRRGVEPVPAESFSARLQGLVALNANAWTYADSFGQIWSIETSPASTVVSRVEIPQLNNSGYQNVVVKMVDGQLMASGWQMLPRPENERRNFDLGRPFVAMIDAGNPRSWSLGTWINVPGSVVSLIRNQNQVVAFLVSEDRIVDFEGGLTEPTLYLAWTKGQQSQKVALTSLMASASSLERQLVRTAPFQWMFVESDEARSYSYEENAPLRLGQVAVDMRTRTLHRSIRNVEEPLAGYDRRVLGVFTEAAGSNAQIVILASSRSLQAVRVRGALQSVEPLMIEPTGLFLEPGGSTSFRHLSLPTYWRSRNGVFSFNQGRFRMALGDFGVIEGTLTEMPAEPTEQARP